jgi:hypothetical protein
VENSGAVSYASKAWGRWASTGERRLRGFEKLRSDNLGNGDTEDEIA